MSSTQDVGYWSIATQKHLKKYQSDSANFDEFDALHVSGKAGRLIGMLRGNNKIESMPKLKKMAGTIGIGGFELNNILPVLEKVSDKQIEVKRNTYDEIIGIEEYVYTNEDVLNISGSLFEYQNPSDIQRIAVHSLGETKKLPQLEIELMQKLHKLGYSDQDIEISCAIQQQFKLLQKFDKGKEPIYSNEYVWGTNHHKIAYGIKDLDIADKDDLTALIDSIQKKQGFPIEDLPPIAPNLLNLALKTGIINPTIVATNRGIKKEFGFSSNLIGEGLYNDDILDDVKILLASMRFSERYTQYSKIHDLNSFLRALIDRDKVGPHSANGTDYILLEKKGIIETIPDSKGKYFMRLLKKDVGEAALKIINEPNFDIQTEVEPINANRFNTQGEFISPEEIRMSYSESPENIKEATDHLLRTVRGETI
ncbi:hypothetical protein [Sediminibacillus terrae]|uniref:hypothetical protein n=1 Tax=Sediminibacillus terrae TaxID=1562106 RepID=UPI0012968FDF|nr:hypothetical protein [Sediminibacillus terrae]